ncbi:MAG: phospholipase D-like domain-containing protein [Bdellovibrionia bacterium]
MNNRIRTYNRTGSVWFASVFFILAGCNSVFAFPVLVSNAPSSDLALTINAIQSAKKSLLLNVYELTSPEITDAIIGQIQAGIQVEILEEGQPVGGISAVGRGVQAKLVQAMRGMGKNNHFFIMTAKSVTNRRFHCDHAKYGVIDGNKLLIGSENYSPTGNPEPNSIGNRGWAVFVEDPTIAQEFVNLFRKDTETSHSDLIEITGSPELLKYSQPAYLTDNHSQIKHSPRSNEDNPVLVDASAVYKITSPDTSRSGIIALIDQAKSSIDIEQMTFDSGWGGAPSVKSPIYEAVIRAARRGVTIRVLLNDESVFNHGGHRKSKNRPTVDSLNQIGESENLKLSAAIANVQAMNVDYIHNKGMIIDQDKTLISSINWNQNSVDNNREAAVVLISTQAYDYYRALFDKDWNAGHEAPHQEVSVSPSIDPDPLCPQKVTVSLDVGPIKDDRYYDIFKELTETKTQRVFVKISNTATQGCILEDSSDLAARTKKFRFVQLHQKKDGTWTLALEGYTQKGRIFSIRTSFAKDPEFTGQDLTAVLYGGSGLSEQIAPATLSLNLTQNDKNLNSYK